MGEIKLKIASVVIGSSEGGGSGVEPYYTDLPDKPSINGETLAGNMTSEDLGLASAGQSVPSGGTTGQVLAKKSNADNDVQWVNQESGGTQVVANPSGTATQQLAKVQIGETIYTNPKGDNGITPTIDPTTKHWLIGSTDSGIVAEGQNGQDAVNPFNGWFDAVITGDAGSRVITSETQNLPENPVVGDYAYVKTWEISGTAPSQTETPIVKIYECTTAGTWSDSGRTADTSNVQTFASSEEVNEVHIVKDLITGGADDVLSAEQGKVIADVTMKLVYDGNILDPSTIRLDKKINTSNGNQHNMGESAYEFMIGCTDYIKIPEEGLIINHGVSQRSSTSAGCATYEDDGNGNPGTYSGRLSAEEDGDPIIVNQSTQNKWVRFNLPIVEAPDGLAIYHGTTLPTPSYQPYEPPYWEQKEARISDGAISNSKLANGAVTIDKMSPTELEFNSDNVANPEEITAFDGYYINGETGDVGHSSTGKAKGYTGYIPIDSKGLYCANTYVAGAVIGYAYYNSQKQYLNGFFIGNSTHPATNVPQGCTNNYAPYIEGASYVRFSLNSTTNVMVCKGSGDKPYTPYAGQREVISKEILPNFSGGGSSDEETYIDGVEVVLPNEIVITKTDRLQLFYRNIVSAFNPYDFEVQCVCSVGKPYPRYFEYVPSASITTPKSYTLQVNVYDNAHRLIASGSTIIRIVANASSPIQNKNILLIGASTLSDGVIVNEVSRRFTGSDGNGTCYNPTGLGLSNISFVGRTTTSNPNVKQESQSGWQWKDYATSGRKLYRFFVVGQVGIDVRPGAVYSGNGTLKFTVSDSDIDIDRITGNGYFTCTYDGSGTQPATGTLTLYSGEGDATITYDSYEIDSRNPFWDDEHSELDFTTYINTYCGGQLDYFVSYLGINDIFQSRTPLETSEVYIKPFLRALHTQSPNTKVILCTLHIPSPYGGMGTSYGASATNTYWMKCAKYFDYVSVLKELETDDEFSSWVSVCSSFQEFDGENLYPESTNRTACNRSEKIDNVQTNGVHPTVDGKKQIADSIYHKLTELL